MQKIIPSLWFEEGCEEGINLYVSTFNSSPGKKSESKVVSIQRYPEHFESAPWPPQMSGKVITAIFELEGQKFLALDGGPGVFPKSGPVSLMIECDTQEEIDHFWSLSANPQAEQCGWIQDKYGFSWQITPKIMGELLSDPDKAKADRAMKAMLEMKKIDIAELKRAHSGA